MTPKDDNGMPRIYENEDESTFEIFSRLCIAGESFSANGTCVECQSGFYTLEPPEEETECLPCAHNAKCYGETHIVPREGYWRTDINSDDILECWGEEHCTGHDTCLEGHMGIVCSECAEGRAAIPLSLDCKLCSDKLESKAALRIGMNFLLVFVFTSLNRNSCEE